MTTICMTDTGDVAAVQYCAMLLYTSNDTLFFFFFQYLRNFHKIQKKKSIYHTVGCRSWIIPVLVNTGNISGVPVLHENVILTFFRKCWCYPEAHNTETHNRLVLSNTLVHHQYRT